MALNAEGRGKLLVPFPPRMRFVIVGKVLFLAELHPNLFFGTQRKESPVHERQSAKFSVVAKRDDMTKHFIAEDFHNKKKNNILSFERTIYKNKKWLNLKYFVSKDL